MGSKIINFIYAALGFILLAFVVVMLSIVGFFFLIIAFTIIGLGLLATLFKKRTTFSTSTETTVITIPVKQ